MSRGYFVNMEFVVKNNQIQISNFGLIIMNNKIKIKYCGMYMYYKF